MKKLILATLLTLCASSIYAYDSRVIVKTNGAYVVNGKIIKLQTQSLSSKHSSYNKPNEDTRLPKPTR